MDILKKADYGYLLQQSLSDLHHESVTWLSEIQFLETEYQFFKRILKKYSEPVHPKQPEAMIEELNQKLSILRKDVVEEFGVDLKSHEIYLRDLLDTKPGYDDNSYREKHLAVAEAMKSLQKRHQDFEKELEYLRTGIL